MQSPEAGGGPYEALFSRLISASQSEGREALVQHLRGAGNGQGAATALLAHPQLRSYGLLAARILGREDLVLGCLGDPQLWKQAAGLLCQVRPQGWKGGWAG